MTVQETIICPSTYQRNDNLTIGVSLEVVLGLQVLAEDTVVVDFAVNGEGEGGVIVDKGLGTGVLGIISNALIINQEIFEYHFTHQHRRYTDAHESELPAHNG